MHRIVVAGGGYTGLMAATGLAGRLRKRDDVAITVVDASERFTERLRLHQTATGQELADLRVPDLLAGSGVEFAVGRVTAVDVAGRTVRVDDGRALPYDTLVYALGGVSDTGAVPGAADHAHTLDSRADAEAFGRRLAGMATGTVAVLGSGLTGVEAAAELAERHPRLRVVLVGRAAPGADLSGKARAHLDAAFARLGIGVRTGQVVTVLPDSLALADGDTVAADVVLWTGGVRIPPLAPGLAVDERGRVETDTALRSVSHPEVYAVGDAAAVRQGYGVLHGTCQSGMPTGAHVAASIARELRGREPKPFRFGYYHLPVSLGRGDAVVQFTRPDGRPRRLSLRGRFAVWYKETVSSSPWAVFAWSLKAPGLTARWPHGGRHTR